MSSASAVMPTNIDIAMPPMSASVVAAFWLLGLRNAGTPLAIASTPVSAVQPDGEGAQREEDEGEPGQRVLALGSATTV